MLTVPLSWRPRYTPCKLTETYTKAYSWFSITKSKKKIDRFTTEWNFACSITTLHLTKSGVGLRNDNRPDRVLPTPITDWEASRWTHNIGLLQRFLYVLETICRKSFDLWGSFATIFLRMISSGISCRIPNIALCSLSSLGLLRLDPLPFLLVLVVLGFSP